MEGSERRTMPSVPVATGAAASSGDDTSREPVRAPARADRLAAEGRSLRRRILLRLRRDGPASPDRLASDLGASRNGVLRQLQALEAGGLVSHAAIRHGVGRPRHHYDVTPEAQDLFPANYDGLAVSLLGAIGTVGGQELLERIVAARRASLAERARDHLDDRAGREAPLPVRVRELAVFQDQLGYLAESEVGPDGELRIHQHNCAIHRVAAGEPAVCEAELELFRELLGVEVERESHIVSGDRSCTYRVGGGAEGSPTP